MFRLYTKTLYEKFDEHEQSEVHRQPLQDVILKLKSMLEGSQDHGIKGMDIVYLCSRLYALMVLHF